MTESRKVAKATAEKRVASSENDERPDAWDRFQKAVDAAVRSGPKHRIEAKKSRTKTAAS